MGRWFLALGLLLTALIVAFAILSVTGVIDAPALFWRLSSKSSRLEPYLETYSKGRLAEEWIADRENELQAEQVKLNDYEQQLKAQEEQLAGRALELANREKELQKRLDALEQELSSRQSIQGLVEIYTEMPTEEAARILEKMEESLVLQVLAGMDRRDAANILTKLPTNLAVALSKQLGQQD